MTQRPEQVFPAKCRKCDRQMSSPLVCDYCKELNPAAAVTDYFTLLGLPQRFDLDEGELHDKYVALSRFAHPDFHAGEPEEVQRLHLRVSAAINDAYGTLKDPAARAAYLLELLGGKGSAQDKSVPDGFLGTMMMMQEELADAKSAGDAAELGRLRKVLQTQHDGLLRRIAGFFSDLEQAVGCEAVRADLLGEIRKQSNAVSYVKKLLSLA
ncbi:MAG TPA: Fe-S protein assembly co-chaperone HscB [Phycisphaerae bacterium]|nr:Fe-S protein assembly co-chaperone HscB [Phycisphaerae bacterium]